MAQPKPVDHSTDTGYPPEPSEGAVLTPEESRQGVISGRVVMILMTSLVLALTAFVILYSTEIV